MKFLPKAEMKVYASQPVNAASRHRPQQRLLILMLVAALAMLGALFSPAQPAEASGDYGYHWTLAFDFDASFDGVLTVEAGPGKVNKLDKVYVTRKYAVSCNRIGNVALGGSKAVFDGGYLRCSLDLASAINATMSACREIDRNCSYTLPPVEQYGGLKMYANVLSTQTGMAPIYHHPDASFAVDVSTATVTLHNTVNPVPGVITSQVVPLPLLPPTMQYYAARYICAAGPVCDMFYSVAGGVTQVGPYAKVVEMQTGPTAFYVGHNPDTGETVPSMTAFDDVFIDPAATGEN